MRRAISDPTGGERARKLGGYRGRLLRRVDPTDPRYRTRGEADPGLDPTDARKSGAPATLEAGSLPHATEDAMEATPRGHVFGHRRGEPLPAQDPTAPVLRLRGFRRLRRRK
jgi:hypothetical protein